MYHQLLTEQNKKEIVKVLESTPLLKLYDYLRDVCAGGIPDGFSKVINAPEYIINNFTLLPQEIKEEVTHPLERIIASEIQDRLLDEGLYGDTIETIMEKERVACNERKNLGR